MRIPKGMTEQQVLDIIEEVASKLVYKFKFGYHEIEDMKQEAVVEAIKRARRF